MKTHPSKNVRDARGKVSHKAKINTAVAEEVCSIRELRKAFGLTRRELATLINMTQSEVAKYETRDDHRLERLSDLVHDLGGKLEVVAVLGDKRVRVALLDVSTFPEDSARQELLDLARAMKAPRAAASTRRA
jgi:transcriptional regulator with XRE-family HTH domain